MFFEEIFEILEGLRSEVDDLSKYVDEDVSQRLTDVLRDLEGLGGRINQSASDSLSVQQIGIQINIIYNQGSISTEVYRRLSGFIEQLTERLNSMSRETSKIVSTTIVELREEKTGNLFWLCHDMMELFRWLLDGVSKEWLDIGFRQSYHHAIQLDLDKEILQNLEQLRNNADHISETEWTPQNRQHFAARVKIVFNAIAQIAQRHDPNFDSGPG